MIPDLALLLLSGMGTFSFPSEPTMMVHPPFGHCMGIYRAGTEQLALLLGGLVRFDDPQGLACVKLDEWNDPDRTGDDDELAVYGVNSGSGHIIYNADMYTLGLYGGSGSGDDELLHPHGIAADPTGLVLVADTGNDRVVILRRSGSRLVPDGLIPGDFLEPWGVALDGAGRVYVTDREAGTLSIYESPADITPDVIPLDRPSGIDVVRSEPWFHSEESFIVAVTGGGTELVKLQGDSVSAEVRLADCGGAAFNYPVIDFYGNVWVTDSITCMIHKFDSGLRYLSSFGGPGTGDLEFDRPTGIAVWRRFGQLFIAEAEGARYFWVGSDILDLDISILGRELTVTGRLTEYSNVHACVESAGGETVATLGNGRFPAGELSLSWTGNTGSRNSPAPAGDYRLLIEVEPTYSSRGYFSKSWEHEFAFGPPAELPEPSSAEPPAARGSI
jgi:hypothetical protein